MVRIFRGGVLDERFEGSVVVIGPRPTQMTGLVRGDLFVRDNSVCEVTGMVSGNLLAERTGKAVLKGLVTKACKATGGDLEIYGLVVGDVVNQGGRVYVDKGGVVRGKVIGQTSSVPLPPSAPTVAGTASNPPAAPPSTPPPA
jgi:cytoskeletal protein CcmA (bactofilin family)